MNSIYRHRYSRTTRLAWLAVLSLPAFADLSQTSAPARSWSPDVLSALETYRAGDFVAAQRLGTQILSQARDPRVQRDAAVLETLCLLRMPARADRIDGRTRLQQLIAEDPTLRAEPECELAYGIAETELSETSTALKALERAAADFAQQGLPARQAAALVALAQAWVRHGEWQTTPPQFAVPRPQSATDADAVRRAQIEALRARIAALPDHQAALDELDLVLARHWLDTGDAAGDGLAILTRLAAAPELTRASAEATLTLAERHEQAGQWAGALQAYQRLRQGWHGDLAHQAEQRAAEITRPQIVAEVPAAVPSGQPVRAHVRIRGLKSVQVEVRQVDVEAWLNTPRSRGNEALLPESGSVRLTRELDTRATPAYGWWDSDALETPLEFTGEPGAYVLVVRGAGDDARPAVAKRLIVVSDLRAACYVGARHVVLWAQRGPASAGTLTAKFWMSRSFAPTEVPFDGDVARFALPGEARVMRERGWVCLVRAGEHLAVCRGTLPATEPGQSASQVLLLAGPPEAEVGDSLYISGVLLPARGATELSAESLKLEVLDAVEKVHFTQEIKPPASGAFAMEVPVTADFAGNHLRVLARHGERALENVLGRVTMSVPTPDAARFDVQVEAPAYLPAENMLLTSRVRAVYPWGATPALTPVQCTLRAAALPKTGGEAAPVVAAVERDGRLGPDGQWTFSVPLADFGLPGRPLAVRIEAYVQSREGRTGAGVAEALEAPQRPYAWLLHTPVPPVAGQDVRFRVGWFEPDGRAIAGTPEVVLHRDDREIVRLPLHAEREGWLSAPWQPTEPGSYQATAVLAALGAEPLTLSETLAVLAATKTAPAATPAVHCAAQWVQSADRAAVQVELDGHSEEPLLVLAEDGDPQAARTLAALDGHATVLLPAETKATAGMRVAVARMGGAELELLGSAEVAPDPQRAVEVALTVGQPEVWPGSRVAARVSGGWPTGTTLTARLIDAVNAGYPSEAAEPPGTNVDAWPALSEGSTLWCMSREAERETTEFQVPVPAKPGLYKLIVLARRPGGETANGATILDARRGVRLEINAPARLTLGDRTLLAARVENAYAEPIEARLQCDAGAGMQLETLRVENPGAASTPVQRGEPVTVNLPAQGQAWLYMDAEAARLGTGRATIEVTARGVSSTASCTYEVLPPDSPAESDRNVSVRRSVAVWTPPANYEELDHPPEEEAARWTAVPFSPEARLMPGQFLEVSEEFTLREALPEGTWRQRVPPTCCLVTGQIGRAAPIGPRQSDQDGALVFRVMSLAPGSHVHKYFLAVVRPGAAVIPAPEVRCGPTLLPLAVEPADLRVIVAETK
jgi:tetratricopeptide (TPR) repeat protein